MAKTIVWIDDDIDIINPVVRPLELAGHHFVRLQSVKEALEALERIRKADLILLDMILPPGQTDREFGRYPGLDLLRELREAHNISTPVIALTVVTRNEVLKQLREELGVRDILHKPVRPSVLREHVQRALRDTD
jgi:CheY-like chemotaxis protein